MIDDFEIAFPKPVDFSTAEYDAAKSEIDSAAQAQGYRLAGVRLGRVVFTTKPPREAASEERA